MAQPSYSTLEVDPHQFAPEVAYSTEKQIPYDKTGLEFHDKTAVLKSTLKKRICIPRKPSSKIILSIALAIAICIAVGIGVTALKKKNSAPPDTAPTPSPSQSTFTPSATDFSIIPTASAIGIPALPTGTFSLPISSVPNISTSSCLSASQTEVWTCTLEIQSSYQMAVSFNTSNTIDEYYLSLGSNISNVLTYGMQEPVITFNTPSILVTDNHDPIGGPAYLFQKSYDKLVILPESTSIARRGAVGSGQGVVQPGDRPWFCYWNETLLEVFIYSNLILISSEASATSISTSTSTISLADAPVPTGSSRYPKAIKMEDSVQSGAPDPYCQQMEIANDGLAMPFLTGTLGTGVKSFNISSGNGTGCGCVWLTQAEGYDLNG